MKFKAKESVATGFVKPKTTALFFDKIWLPNMQIDCSKYIPSQILLTDIDDKVQAELSMMYWHGICNNLARDYNEEKKIQKMIVNEKIFPDNFLFSSDRNAAIIEIVEYCRINQCIEMTPIFIEKTVFEKSLKWFNRVPFEEQMRLSKREGMTQEEFDIQFEALSNRKANALEICIKNIPTAVEEKLNWEQITEIRKDKNSFNSIKRFKQRLNAEFIDKSESEIIECFEKAIDDYKFAIKKHGIPTTIGGLSTILTSTASIITSLMDNPLEIISTGFIISAGIFTFTAQQVAEYLEKKREPIAFLYNIDNIIKN
jgi:hypothetical protein